MEKKGREIATVRCLFLLECISHRVINHRLLRLPRGNERVRTKHEGTNDSLGEKMLEISLSLRCREIARCVLGEGIEAKVKGEKKNEHDKTHAISSVSRIKHNILETVTLMSPVIHSKHHGESFPFNRALSRSPRELRTKHSYNSNASEEGKRRREGRRSTRRGLCRREEQIHRTVRLLNTRRAKVESRKEAYETGANHTRTFADATRARPSLFSFPLSFSLVSQASSQASR